MMPQEGRLEAQPDIETWRRLAESGLKGRPFSVLQSRSHDGILIEPLYPPARRTSAVPNRGGQPWTSFQIVAHADADQANADAVEDIRGGAEGLALRFAGRGQGGIPHDRGAMLALLEGVDLGAVSLRLEPGPGSAELAGWVAELIARQGLAPERAKVSFGLDVLGGGAFDNDMERRVSRFLALREAGLRGAIAELDGRPVHEAGGSEAQELAAVLAAAAWWLRSLDARGMAPADAFPCFGVSLSADRDFFLSLAKLRALRVLWARLLEVCGVPQQPLRIHAETSRRMMTRADPHTNIIRATIAGFAAAVGGADSLAVLPYDAALPAADPLARRVARNTHHLLREEAQLHRIDDPAAGAGSVEALTAALAQAAWGEFQILEREGGLLHSLNKGLFGARIGAAREALRAELSAGEAPLVGATIYRIDGVDPAGAADDLGEQAGWLPPVRLESLASRAG